jgi:hypothetical protein
MIKFFIKLICISFLTLVVAEPSIAASARIDSTTGRVRIKREGGAKFFPVATGTSLNEGDEIFPDKRVRVKVLCPDLKWSLPIPSGVRSGFKKFCPNWNVIIDKAPPDGILGGINPNIPYLISPRHTLLLTNTPTIRWNAVYGAKHYTLSLLNNIQVVWRTQVKDSVVNYQGKPALQPVVPYSIEVVTNTGKSSTEDKALSLNFIILRPTEVTSIKNQVAKITQISMSQQLKALTLANYYSSYALPRKLITEYKLTEENFNTYNLTNEAIATLESLIRRNNSSVIQHFRQL